MTDVASRPLRAAGTPPLGRAAVHANDPGQGSTATQQPAARTPVWVLVTEGFEMLDLAGPVQVLHAASGHGAGYEVRAVGLDREVVSAQGIVVNVEARLPEVRPGDRILIPGVHAPRRDMTRPAVVDWIRAAAEGGARLSSICSGAFLLGRAGLLDGRRCTTHWQLTAELARRYPNAEVVEDAIFVDDGPVTTSAGVASGIDLALWLVERDCGPIVTARTARELVVYLRRDGTHLQTSVYLDYRTHMNPLVHRAQDWIQAHFTEPLTLQALGREVGASGRHLARSFKASTGVTPWRYQQLLRLELARTLMASPELNLETISARCGFGDVRSFRRAWRSDNGESPSSHRAAR